MHTTAMTINYPKDEKESVSFKIILHPADNFSEANCFSLSYSFTYLIPMVYGSKTFLFCLKRVFWQKVFFSRNLL